MSALRLSLTGLVLCLAAPIEAQTITPLVWPTPYYPLIAQATRAHGDVEVAVHVRPDGTVAAAEAVKGPAGLQEASVDAAKRTRFHCQDCAAPSTLYSLYVTFRLYGGRCRQTPPPLIVSPTQGWVTVDEPPPMLNADYVWLKVRGPRCLYLWLCEAEWGGMHETHVRVRSARCLGLWNCGWRKRPPPDPPPACPGGSP